MSIFISLALMLAAFQVSGQNGSPPSAGAKGLSMGNAAVNFHDINSIFSNQAGLAFLDNWSAMIHAESRFLLPEIKMINAGFAYPTSFGTFGLSVSYFGFDLYNEQKIGISYARKLFDDVAIGVQFDYLGTSIAEYGNSGRFTFEGGVQARLMEMFLVGAHVYSPIRVSLTENENLPTEFTAGVTWEASDKFLIAVEIEKDIDFPASFHGGLEYLILDKLALRAGVSTQPVQNTFGIGLFLGNLVIDIGSAYHQELGFTPSVSIAFQQKKKSSGNAEEPY
ncbi:MAG: hypothetical protein AAF502_18700 [Bacteroidota bacterium]